MKLLVNKNNEDIEIKIDINGVPNDFDYINLINEIYNNNKIDKTDFDDSINEWEQKAINELVDKINSIIKKPEVGIPQESNDGSDNVLDTLSDVSSDYPPFE